MTTQSIDTHPKAERALISLIRQATPAKKLSQVRSLSQTMIRLSRRAIMRANENIDEQEANLVFVTHHYGSDLSEHLRKYLDNRTGRYEKPPCKSTFKNLPVSQQIFVDSTVRYGYNTHRIDDG